MTSISNLGVQILTTYNLQNQQSNMETLTEQLSSNKQHSNLTDYDPVDAHNILDFQNGITQRQAYISGMQTVSTRLNVYDSTMTDMESLTSQAKALVTQNQTLDPTKTAQLAAQANSFLQQVQDDLNQQVGGRYIYSGSRYATQPVATLTSLGAPSIPFTPATTPTLTDYDTEYNPPGTTTDAAAYAQDSVAVDNSFNVQYGVTSNAPGFQQLIAGLRVFNNATTLTDPTQFQTAMVNASNLLSTALQNIQSTHATVAGNINTLTQQTANQNTDITNLQNQLGNIQNVDVTKIGAEIDTLQTQLQASYSATAGIIQQSILKYL